MNSDSAIVTQKIANYVIISHDREFLEAISDYYFKLDAELSKANVRFIGVDGFDQFDDQYKPDLIISVLNLTNLDTVLSNIAHNQELIELYGSIENYRHITYGIVSDENSNIITTVDYRKFTISTYPDLLDEIANHILSFE